MQSPTQRWEVMPKIRYSLLQIRSLEPSMIFCLKEELDALLFICKCLSSIKFSFNS